LIVAVAIGVVAVVSKARKPSAEEHLKEFYAAERSRRVVGGGIGAPTLRDKLAKRWYQLRGKRDVDFLNEMAKHRAALEDLGYLETQAFVVSNRSALYVQTNVWYKAYPTERANIANGLANIWMSAARDRIYVSAPKTDMPKWESWISESDVPE
jgi:hypothetical protein